MVLNIVDANKWKKPIYFAVTVSNDNLMGLQPYLQMQGLVYRVQNERVGRNERIDIDRTLYYLDNVYQFRGLGNGEAPMSETARKLMSNYAAGFIQVAMALDDQLRKLNSEIVTLEADTTSATPRLAAKRAEYEEKLDTAIRKLDECVNLMPWDWRPRLLRQEVMITHGRHEGALERVQRARLIEPGRTEYLQMEAQLLDKLGRHDEANQIWQQLASNDVDPWRAYLSMATNFTDMGMYDSAISVMKQFLKHHPGDRRANAMIARMETMKAEQASQAIEQPVTEETVGNPN
jgi:tetratricopeptide (TPR) repeat protein